MTSVDIVRINILFSKSLFTRILMTKICFNFFRKKSPHKNWTYWAFLKSSMCSSKVEHPKCRFDIYTQSVEIIYFSTFAWSFWTTCFQGDTFDKKNSQDFRLEAFKRSYPWEAQKNFTKYLLGGQRVVEKIFRKKNYFQTFFPSKLKLFFSSLLDWSWT